MADKSKFYLVEIEVDGPNRLQGSRGYQTHAAARLSAEKYLREYPSRRVTIMQAHETMWVDPSPAILDDLPKAYAAEPA